MARTERVVLALVSLEKTGKAILLSQRFHSACPPGEQLVRIALVTDVPHNLVSRSVERRVNGNGQLDHAKAGADVPSCSGAHFDEALADFRREGAQVIARHASQRGRKISGFEDRHLFVQ